MNVNSLLLLAGTFCNGGHTLNMHQGGKMKQSLGTGGIDYLFLYSLREEKSHSQYGENCTSGAPSAPCFVQISVCKEVFFPPESDITGQTTPPFGIEAGNKRWP